MFEDGVDAEVMNKIKMICEILPQSDESKLVTPLQRLSSSGALQFVFALATQVVYKLSGSAKISLSLGDSTSSSSLASAPISVELRRPASFESFVYSLTVWQTLLSATGLSNSVVIGPFLTEVVHDVVPLHGWKVAFEHFCFTFKRLTPGAVGRLPMQPLWGVMIPFFTRLCVPQVMPRLRGRPLFGPPAPLAQVAIHPLQISPSGGTANSPPLLRAPARPSILAKSTFGWGRTALASSTMSVTNGSQTKVRTVGARALTRAMLAPTQQKLRASQNRAFPGGVPCTI